MLVNAVHDSPSEHRRLLVAGVVFLTLIATLIWFSIAIFNKKFEDATMVTLKAERAGLQLAKGGDVRRHGVLVGQVRKVSQDGEEAEILVALQPSAARTIPSNATVQILPTTLFGQKFISFLDPAEKSGEPMREGDVIPSSRVETNVELNQVLANLFPLLRSIDPAQLSATLFALATGLQGRGESIGALLEDLDGYATDLTGELPALRRDLILLADVAESYDLAAPDLLSVLRNLTTTADTLVEERDQLATFLGDVTGMAETTTQVLRTNGAGIIRLGELSRPLLQLLDTYSPEYPCLLQGLDKLTGSLSAIFQNARVNQTLEVGSVQRPAYDAGDRPVYGEVGHGPWCLGLPNAKGPSPIPLNDGSDQDEMFGRVAPSSTGPSTGPSTGSSSETPRAAVGATPDRAFGNPTSGYAGTPAEQRLVNTLLGSRTGVSPTSFGSLPSLLYGPQLRGTTVHR